MPLSVLFSQYSTVLPILVFLLFLKKTRGWHLWVIFFYCIYSFSNDTVILYRFNQGESVKGFLYCFTIIEYLIFASFLFSILINKTIKRILIFVSLLFTISCLYLIFMETLKKFDSFQASVSAILLIAFCIVYLFEQINKPEITFIYASYKFWIITGILIYLAATLFLYGFADSLPADVAREYWIISHISNVLKNILFSIAIFIHAKSLKPPQPKTPPSETELQPYLN